MPIDGPTVRIGLKEIYERLCEVDLKLTAVDGKVGRLADAYGAVKEDLDDLEDRVRSLERGRWPLPSVAVLISMGSLLLAAVGMLNGGGSA